VKCALRRRLAAPFDGPLVGICKLDERITAIRKSPRTKLLKIVGTIRHSLLVLIVGFCCCSFDGQQPAIYPCKPAVDKKMDGLLVYGKGFLFSAREPIGWHGDTDKIARYYHANLVFTPDDQTSRAAHVTIRIRVNHKETTGPSEDMQTDMSGYKAKYPDVRFSDLAVSHPKYKICAKLFYFENDFYEYVVYVDPGANVKMNFSVSMSKDSKSATAEEQKAFETVLESLSWITEDISSQ
jgi:hypothetical protein